VRLEDDAIVLRPLEAGDAGALAAAIDDDARTLLQQGRLTHDLQPVGFGFSAEQGRNRKRSSK